jgi:hypothetical protein
VSFNEAVVYVGHTCGLMCGAGFYWHLRKVRDHWVVLEREGGWFA